MASAKRPTRKTAFKKALPTAGKAASPAQVMERLERAIPEALCELNHHDAWELLIATILSAQSTDKTVNAVTPELFRRWPTPAALAEAPQEEVEVVVKRTGFFRNKAKAIRGAAQAVVSEHGGQVPRDLETLTTLPGVARKTANVVLGTAYGIPSGFVVDTHVARVAGRLGLSAHQEPAKIEADLQKQFPQTRWIDMGHRVLLHGRYTCLARAPLCSDCPLNELCPSRQAPPEATWQERAASEARRVPTGIALA
jgi:endonuclease-3